MKKQKSYLNQKIIPCIWFNNNAYNAVKFYTSIFKNSKILQITKYGEADSKASGMPKGSVMTVIFDLDGDRFMALNGGPVFKLSPAVSFIVNCKDQKEIDYFWKRLSKGGKEVQCGWLTDKYGLSWQIVPKGIGKLMSGTNPKKKERVFSAMLKMKKIDIKRLEEVYSNS